MQMMSEKVSKISFTQVFIIWQISFFFVFFCLFLFHLLHLTWILLSFVVLENTAKLKLVFENKFSSDEGRELYHFLRHCFGIQICKNMIVNQRYISFLKHGIYVLFVDDDSERKVNDSGDGWVLDSE